MVISIFFVLVRQFRRMMVPIFEWLLITTRLQAISKDGVLLGFEQRYGGKLIKYLDRHWAFLHTIPIQLEAFKWRNGEFNIQ
jgi:hypothetical protein